MSRQKTRICDGRNIKTYDVKSSAQAYYHHALRHLAESHFGYRRLPLRHILRLYIFPQIRFPIRRLYHFGLDTGDADRIRDYRSSCKSNWGGDLQRIGQKSRWNVVRIRRARI
jgi:hypothetical protein